MKNHAWMVTAVWIGATAICAGSPDRLAVVVQDHIGIESAEMANAADLGRRLFDRLGISTNWVVCRRGDDCPLPPPGSYIWLNIVPWTKGPMLGFANIDSMALGRPQAYVFHASVSRLAGKTHQPLAVPLACVMIHEALHLLGLAHAPHGIMRENFDAHDLLNVTSGRPMLNGSQNNQLREGMARLYAFRPMNSASRDRRD